MANTTAHASNVVTNWKRKAFFEYVRNNRFAKFSGTGENNVIIMKEDERQQFSIPMVHRLTGAGVSGSSALVGSEESLANFGWDITPTYYRNAVRATKEEIEKVNFDMMGAARRVLTNWAMEKHRDRVITALGAIYNGTTYSSYAAATEGAKDTWLGNNDGAAIRVLFGAARSNQSTTDHSASLANVDSSGDKLTAGLVSLVARLAKQSDPHITPLKASEDDEFYVMFVNSLARRDLLGDSAFQQAQREARERGKSNPLFKGGDLLWDNVLIREVPEIPVISGVGGSSIDVAPCYLCGAEAIGWGIGQRPRPTRLKEDDYDFLQGVGIELKEDVKKMFFNNVQNGVFTLFVSGVADS